MSTMKTLFVSVRGSLKTFHAISRFVYFFLRSSYNYTLHLVKDPKVCINTETMYSVSKSHSLYIFLNIYLS